MNKTLSIGLAGFSFMIEEHAYIKLSDYLTALRNSLDPQEAEEVMHDIEIRMVEIFKESLGKREVLNEGDVEKVIAQIGTPEQIDEQEEAYFSEKSKKSEKTKGFSTQKQLFRDPENAKLGGVCAGLAAYFGMEIVWMRLIWVAIAILGIFTAHVSTGLWILLYIVLWIVLPQAKTAADFLKMKGEPMNFDNIRNESSKIIHFTNESAQKVGEVVRQNKNDINNFGNAAWNVIRFFLGGIFGLLGISLLFSAIVLLGASFNNDFINLPGNLQFYLADGFLRNFGLAFAFLTVFIPALIFLFLSIKLISPSTKLNYTGYVFGALVFLWIIFLALFGFNALKYKTMYKGENQETENVAITTNSDSILVDVKKVAIPQNFKSYGNDIYSDLKTVYEENYPRIEVTRKEGTFAPYIMIKKSADGYNQPLKLEVPVEVQGNKVLFPNYIKYPYEYRTRDYDVDYELVVPKTMKVIGLNDEEGFSLDDDENATKTNSGDKVKVKVGGLSIEVNPDDEDSIRINGKNFEKDSAEKIIKQKLPKGLKDLDKLKDLDIRIHDKDGNVSIKTK